MSAIVSLSPWSSFWTMGQGGGTSSDFVAVECLKQISPHVMHFVEGGSPIDADNIPVAVRRGSVNRWLSRVLRHAGRVGRQALFQLEKAQWQHYNDGFAAAVQVELQARGISQLDLVYCHTSQTVECGRRLGLIYRCPVVSHFYGTFLASCIGDPAAYLRYPDEVCGWRTPVALRICNDDGTRGLAVAIDLGLPLDRFLFQPHGLDTVELDATADDVPAVPPPEGALIVITASRLATWKRLDRLIRAIPVVVDRVPNAHFMIVGDGPQQAELQKLADDCGAARSVSFVGPLPRRAVFGLMRHSHVFASTNDVSNVSRGLKEAMYLGLPIVAVDTGDTGQLVRDGVTGRLVAPDDERELASALCELLAQPELRREMGQAAKAQIEEREPRQQAIMQQRVAVLRSLIGSRSATPGSTDHNQPRLQ